MQQNHFIYDSLEKVPTVGGGTKLFPAYFTA